MFFSSVTKVTKKNPKTPEKISEDSGYFILFNYNYIKEYFILIHKIMDISGKAEAGEFDGPRCPYRCECGVLMMKQSRKGHENTKKHYKRMKKLNPDFDINVPVIWTKLTLKQRWGSDKPGQNPVKYAWEK